MSVTALIFVRTLMALLALVVVSALVWEGDPETQIATELLANDGDTLGSATTALEVG